MSTFRFRAPLIVLVSLGLLLPPTAPAGAQQKGVIKIATQSPLSGEQAALGEGTKLGTQLAVEQRKEPVERLTFKLELIAFDDEAKPEVAVANARKIIGDSNILLVIGHLNGTAIAASGIYNDVQLALISPAIHPHVTDRDYSNVNRVSGRDDVQGVAGAEFAKSLKIKTVYVIHGKTMYGQRVAESFRDHAEKLGITVVGFEGTREASNFDAIIAPITAKNPDLIYFGGIYKQAAPFFKQAREKGVTSKFMGPEGMDSSDLVKIARKAVVGMYYTSLAAPVAAYPNGKAFAKAYKEQFKKDPEPFAVQAYDAAAIGLKAIETAIKEAGGEMPSRRAVAAAIRKITHAGITGNLEFDAKGDLRKAHYFVFQVGSDDPAKWGENKEVKRFALARSLLRK